MAHNRRQIPHTQVTSYDMPRESEYHEVPRRIPSFASDVLGVCLLAFIFAALPSYAFARDVWTAAGVGATAAFVILIWRTWRILDRPISEVKEVVFQPIWTDPEPIERDRTVVRIPRGDGDLVEFRQPKAGEFASWARAVITDARNPAMQWYDRTSFSQNTAVSRGWTVEQYKAMYAAMELAGWVERGPNRTPLPTAEGVRALARWLRNRQYRAPDGGSGGGVTRLDTTDQNGQNGVGGA